MNVQLAGIIVTPMPSVPICQAPAKMVLVASARMGLQTMVEHVKTLTNVTMGDVT